MRVQLFAGLVTTWQEGAVHHHFCRAWIQLIEQRSYKDAGARERTVELRRRTPQSPLRQDQG